MSPRREPAIDDQQLVDYLLRLVPEADAERLDEATIADGEVASRLCVVENDLIDAYVSGALPGRMRERFESFYLASERRRRRVRFAEDFHRAARSPVIHRRTRRRGTARTDT